MTIEITSEWNEETQEWYLSATDVVAVLTDSADTKQYIKKMRSRDPELNSSWGTSLYPNCNDGIRWKKYKTTAHYAGARTHEKAGCGTVN